MAESEGAPLGASSIPSHPIVGLFIHLEAYRCNQKNVAFLHLYHPLSVC